MSFQPVAILESNGDIWLPHKKLICISVGIVPPTWFALSQARSYIFPVFVLV